MPFATRSSVHRAVLGAAVAILPGAFTNVASAQAVRFSASGNTIRIMGETVLGDHYTIEAMVMRDLVDSFGSDRLFGEQLNAQEDKSLTMSDTGSRGGVWSSSCQPAGVGIDGPITANAWRHVAFVRNGGALTFYVDGQSVAATTTTCPSLNAPGSNMSLGAFPYTSSTFVQGAFLGRVDWFRISSTARYTAAFQRPVCEPDSDGNTLMLFKFNDAPGTTSPVDSGPSHFATAVATGFPTATAPTFGHAGAPSSGGTAVLNRTTAATCQSAGAQFSVNAPVDATSYQWQLETSPGQWLDLESNPTPLPCGGNASHALATPANSRAVTIGLHGCPGPFNVRCLVTTPCGVLTSNTALLLISPADIGRAGGLVGPDGDYDNNDFIAFISEFFAGHATADMGKAGGQLGPDGAFDNNDFISFINLFFAGC